MTESHEASLQAETLAEAGQQSAGERQDWWLRPWLLAGLLGLAGMLIHFAGDDHQESAGHMALVAFLFFGSLWAAFSLEIDRWWEVAISAVVAGLVMAGLAWQAVNGADHYASQEYGFAAGILATLLALPLFQAGFHRTRFATPYRETHFFVWTDAVGAGGALAFVGATWLMLFVLAGLFSVIQIHVLRDLMNEGWFGWTVSGAAFGAALGVLRNQLKLLGTLQSVVVLVLSLLAVPLAAGLALFLLAMIVSGPDVLWRATESATPLLLACAAGAFILTNAIVRDDDTDMTRSGVMRVTSFILAIAILPLAVFAAVSMGTRIAQHGLSPERLWALLAIAVACAYGVAAVSAAIRGRVRQWRPFLRQSNLHLAAVLSVVALFLALPILDFGSISAKNQIARLEHGEVSAEDFDYDSLRWDFGNAGRKALAELAKSEDKTIAKLASEAQESETRQWYRPREASEKRDGRLANVNFQFEDAALREEVKKLVRQENGLCYQPCVVLNVGPTKQEQLWLAVVTGNNVQYLGRGKDGTLQYDYMIERGKVDGQVSVYPETGSDPANAIPQVDVRPFNGRQIYVNGHPVGQPFE